MGIDAFDDTVALTDKYRRRSGRVFLSGIQALVRLPLLQRERDRARGLNTAGFISGYRGSPLATYDTALWEAKEELRKGDIHFQPGLNEELAATSAWGTQQIGLQPGATVDGVFAIWYAKGPGVDRAMDALKHASAAGTARLGGVLAVVGDDHGAQSSTLLHQSEQMLAAAVIPILNPSDVQEHITFGLFGFELSRFAGCWVALKATTEVIESSASIDAAELHFPTLPADFVSPAGGLSIRWPDTSADQERRMLGPRLDAVAAFARTNPVDRVELAGGAAQLGIATTGKAYFDVIEGLRELGIGKREADLLGIRLYKVGLSWPLEEAGVRRFAEGLNEILVVEEKRAFIEPQLLAAVQFMQSAPRVVGKADQLGQQLIPSQGELSPPLVALAIIDRLRQLNVDVSQFDARVGELRVLIAESASPATLERRAFFCSGCPHNSSTKLPTGSRALAGTGCHSMAMSVPNRNASSLTQMGGEGANWIGQAPFTKESHIFVNLGDGTFSHSGLLAIRAAAAAGVNVTYKILYNDAVAMTGGQENDAHLKVEQIAHQVLAEGAKRVVVVAEYISRHNRKLFPASVELWDRGELDRVQRELRAIPGLTVLIYDQVCAAEKRRRRKRKQYPIASKRVFINDEVCEDCGDCSVQSNCISVAPVQTALGRKRVIDQSSCNADYSCTNGFCPSFVTLADAKPRSLKTEGGPWEAAMASLTYPRLPELDNPYNVLITGIGGTGVITVGAVMGMAGHLEGKAVTVLDFTGLAQKNGAVTSHVRLAKSSDALGVTRMVAKSADLLLGCDAVVAASPVAISRVGSTTRVVINTYIAPPAAFVLNPDIALESSTLIEPLRAIVGNARINCIDATRFATRLSGDSIFANLFMLGFAWQRGAVPLNLSSLTRAIELNGVAIAANQRAFALGRVAANQPELFASLDDKLSGKSNPSTASAIIADRRRRLVAYQNEAYAARYERLIEATKVAEGRADGAEGNLSKAVAWNFYKLMAYKDEYEVARLYTTGHFARKLKDQFERYGRVEVYLAPPAFSRRDRQTGVPRKIAFGPWIFPVFGLLSRLKRLRGTRFDVFGYSRERRFERDLIAQYESTMHEVLKQLGSHNLAIATALAELPSIIRGYGHVKERSMAIAATRRETLLANFRNERPAQSLTGFRELEKADVA